MDQEQDLIVFTDEDGNEGTLKVLDYFYYNGDEYAVITVVDDEEACDDPGCEHCHDESCDCASEEDVFFMKVIPMEDEQVELVPVDDELANKLMEVISNRYDEEDEDAEDAEETEQE